MKKELKYTETHEWIRVEDAVAFIGITEYAQEALGDIVYVECPEVGAEISRGDEVVNIESVKVAEAVYAPVSGTVERVNTDLEGAPEIINKDAQGTFIYSVRMSNPSELDAYMDAAQYKNFVSTGE